MADEKSLPTPPSTQSPVLAHGKHLFGGIKSILVRAAEVMPEENYGFRPVETVRTFGQIVGHIADAQYLFCAGVVGEKSPRLNIEQKVTSKTDLIVALKEAFAYCDRAYASMNEVSAEEMMKFMGRENPKFGVLTVSAIHTIEHYGNLVTYMRMKNVVPPTSDAEFMKSLSR